MGGLQSQLQEVQLERSTLQSRLKTSQAEIDSLQQLRQWYQQQLALAQEARVRLQNEMASMQVQIMDFFSFFNQSLIFVVVRVDRLFFLSQAGQMTQIGVVEHLKLENVTLSHQLTETQHRSIKDKERIAVQLQSIEVHIHSNNPLYLFSHQVCKFYSIYPVFRKHLILGFLIINIHFSVVQADMLTQEANYKQIQDAKAMVEDDLQHKLDEYEEERERLLKLANTASTLERELEQVATLK